MVVLIYVYNDGVWRLSLQNCRKHQKKHNYVQWGNIEDLKSRERERKGKRDRAILWIRVEIRLITSITAKWQLCCKATYSSRHNCSAVKNGHFCVTLNWKPLEIVHFSALLSFQWINLLFQRCTKRRCCRSSCSTMWMEAAHICTLNCTAWQK